MIQELNCWQDVCVCLYYTIGLYFDLHSERIYLDHLCIYLGQLQQSQIKNIILLHFEMGSKRALVRASEHGSRKLLLVQI